MLSFEDPYTYVDTFTYDVTDEGDELLVSNGEFTNFRMGFRVADAELVEIVSFTEPAEREGYVVSEVTYTVKATEPYEWSKDLDLTSFASLYEQLSSEAIEHTVILAKTPEGWTNDLRVIPTKP